MMVRRILTLGVLACFTLTSRAGAADPAVALPTGGESEVPRGDTVCGTLLMISDGGYESGYAWRYEGTVPPYFGAFAECYEGELAICAAVFDFTQIGNQHGQVMDVYVWDDAEGIPGAVRCLVEGVDPGPVAHWLAKSRHTILLPDICCTDAYWWIGYWGDWPGLTNGWLVGADLHGGPWERFCPYTNIAPGLGFPTGWQDVSAVWGPTAALGIGAEVVPCGPTPTDVTSWGSIKALYSETR